MENVYDPSAEKHDCFDLILFLGILYHLRNPLFAIDALRSVAKPGELLFVETARVADQFRMSTRQRFYRVLL